jgi:hypothetical protein
MLERSEASQEGVDFDVYTFLRFGQRYVPELTNRSELLDNVFGLLRGGSRASQ